MSKAIIQVLADLIKLHQRLNEFALEKTEIIKKNDMPSLDALLKKESAFIQQLRKLEEDRLYVTSDYMRSKGIETEGVTMAKLIELMPKEEQPLLKKLQQALLSEIERLRTNNELNQQLLLDSLRFVNFSLDLIAPEPEEVNYQRPTKTETGPSHGRSLFDSKA